MQLPEIIQVFAVDLTRALLIEDLCRRVRALVEHRRATGRIRRHHALRRTIHERGKNRLLHRLATEDSGYPQRGASFPSFSKSSEMLR